MSRCHIHFLTVDDMRSIDGWQPDREPTRFVGGAGHHLVELFARLRDRGLPVSIGRVPPRHTGLVVVSLEALAGWSAGWRARGVMLLGLSALRCPHVVVIRGDHPLAVHPPSYVRSQVAPTRTAVSDGHQQWLPLLPQRGMVARDPSRSHRVETLALKVFDTNVPDDVYDAHFGAALGALGVELRVDTDPSRWPDFHDVDVVLCARRHDQRFDAAPMARKPATKLVNAWVAGCIPLVAPEAGYLELATDGLDALVVHSNRDVIDAVTRLRDEPDQAARMFAAASRRGGEFSTDSVLDQWQQYLWDQPHCIAGRGRVVVDTACAIASTGRRRLRGLVRHRASANRLQVG